MLNLYVLFPLLAIIIRFGTEHVRPSTQLHYTFRNATVSYCHTVFDLPFFKGNFLVPQNSLEHDIESRKCLTRAPSVSLCARKGMWACTHVRVWWCVCLCVRVCLKFATKHSKCRFDRLFKQRFLGVAKLHTLGLKAHPCFSEYPVTETALKKLHPT